MLVGDVSGHGVGSALLMTTARAMVYDPPKDRFRALSGEGMALGIEEGDALRAPHRRHGRTGAKDAVFNAASGFTGPGQDDAITLAVIELL